jgi:multidrug efflux pump
MLAGHWLTKLEATSSTASMFSRLRDGYVRWLGISLRYPRLMLLLTLSMMLAGIWLLYALPKSFFPIQDTEQIRGVMVASQQASFEAVNDHLLALGERLAQDPNVSSVSSFVGVDAQNPSPITGMISIQLLPKAARQVSAQQLARHFEVMAEEVAGIHFYATATQAMNLDATPSPSAYQVRLSSPDRQQMAQHTRQLALAMQESPYFIGVGHSLQTEGLGLHLRIDKDKASHLGVNQKDINTALYNAFGQRMIATLFGQSQYQRVILTLDPAYQRQPEQLNQLHIPNQQGELIPLSNFATLESVITPLQLEKHHQFPAARIFFDLAPHVGLDSALDEIERLRQGLAGVQAVKLEPTGALAVFAQSQWQQIGLLLGAIIAVYILLGMLYESLIHPLTILSTLLPAVLGGLLSLWFLSLSLDMIAMIAMVLLVGIVMKNAIMMIDFALSALRTQEISAQEAIMQASSLRFRPIMMTSMVALLAAVPLVLGNSLGSELRFVMGSVMIGGLLLSQLLTLFTTPALFLLYENARRD